FCKDVPTTQFLEHPKNQGCKKGVIAAINWFFEHVEEGVILEEDCVPHPDFFPFAAQMLEKYRHEPTISMVCGTNLLGSYSSDSTYLFSQHSFVWGWATWKRTWKNYTKVLKKESEYLHDTALMEQLRTLLSTSHFQGLQKALAGE